MTKPEDYRWSSLGYHGQTDNRDDFLSLDLGMREFVIKGKEERLRRHRKFVYETGAVDDTGNKMKIQKKVVEKERKEDFSMSRADLFKHPQCRFVDCPLPFLSPVF